jgi:hypothetical protein
MAPVTCSQVTGKAGPSASGAGFIISCAMGSSPKAETRHPDSSGICGARGASRLEPVPA